MGRLVEPRSPALRKGRRANLVEGKEESYVERVAKYVPTEIVAGYGAISALVKAVDERDPMRIWTAWGVFVVGVVVTPLYLWRVGKPAPEQKIQIYISTAAFVLWAYALGGPFEMSGYYKQWLGAVLVGVFTWIAGLFAPERRVPAGAVEHPG